MPGTFPFGGAPFGGEPIQGTPSIFSTWNLYDVFVEDLADEQHVLIGTGGVDADVLKVLLTNRRPLKSVDKTYADAVEILAGNGYPLGGVSIQNVGTRVLNVLSLVGQPITITAAGGPVGPFRYAVLYNDVSNRLIGFWAYDDQNPSASQELQDQDLTILHTGVTFLVIAGN